MRLKCPRCDHVEHVEVKVTLFPATYLNGGYAVEAQADIVDQQELQRRFELHYDAVHAPL